MGSGALEILPLPAPVRYRAHIRFRLHADVLYWILLALVVLHIGAALYHRFVQRDSVLGRMLLGW